MTRDAVAEAAKPADAPAGAAPFRFIYVLYALSGFVALLYEVDRIARSLDPRIKKVFV